jgi:hypothetical protein
VGSDRVLRGEVVSFDGSRGVIRARGHGPDAIFESVDLVDVGIGAGDVVEFRRLRQDLVHPPGRFWFVARRIRRASS